MLSNQALKTAVDTRIEGWALPVGGKINGRDLHGETFTESTDICADWFPERPVLWEHGLGEAGAKPIGKVTSWERWPGGIFARAELDRTSPLFAKVKDLIAKGALWFSSGAMSHLVKADGAGRIQRWPWVELSLTTHPANELAVVDFAQVKMMFSEAGLKFALPSEAESAGGQYTYYLKEVSPAEVASAKRFLADAQLGFCEDDLQLYGWSLRWFRQGDASRYTKALPCDSPAAVLGYVQRGERLIWINGDTDIDDVKSVVAHEAAHAAVQAESEARGLDRPLVEREEAAADAYARRASQWRTVARSF